MHPGRDIQSRIRRLRKKYSLQGLAAELERTEDCLLGKSIAHVDARRDAHLDGQRSREEAERTQKGFCTAWSSWA